MYVVFFTFQQSFDCGFLFLPIWYIWHYHDTTFQLKCYSTGLILKWKIQRYHIVRTIQIFNLKIVESGKTDIQSAPMHDSTFSCLVQTLQ
jgi:hypothetical protein